MSLEGTRKGELKGVLENVLKMIEAPSCYAGLKDKAKVWIDSVNTKNEPAAAKALLEEIEADITGIDDLVAFAHSDHAKEIFGDKAGEFAAHAGELKKSGAKYCDCQACSAGLEILKERELIMAFNK